LTGERVPVETMAFEAKTGVFGIMLNTPVRWIQKTDLHTQVGSWS